MPQDLGSRRRVDASPARRRRPERRREDHRYSSVESVEARLCARTQDGLLRKIYDIPPQWIADAIAPLGRHPDFVALGLPSPG